MMTEQSREGVLLLLERLQPFRSSDTFGGVEVLNGRVHLYVMGGEDAVRLAGLRLDDELSRGRLAIHDCPYSHRELVGEINRLSALLLTSTRPQVAGVVSFAPKVDGTGLQITCRPGASIDALRPILKYPFDVEWGNPPTTAPQ